MRTFLFFDSNAIANCTLNKENINKLNQKDYFCFTSMYVIDELTSRKKRKLLQVRDYVKAFVENDKYKRFSIEFQDITKEEIQKELSEEMKKLKDMFGSNIIDYMNTPEKNFEIIRRRNMEKIPPFCEGNSDKGWNDTLIWLDFCEYCKNTSYDNYYFITGDKGINSQDIAKKLEMEFDGITGKENLLIIRNFSSFQEITSFFKMDNTTKKQLPQIEKSDGTISKELIDRCRISIENLFYTLNSDDFGNEWNVKNIKIRCSINQEMAYSFYELLESKTDDYLIYNYIDLKDIFDEMNIECTSIYKIDKKYFDDFILCMHEARKYDRLFKSCISFLTTTINNMYEEIYII